MSSKDIVKIPEIKEMIGILSKEIIDLKEKLKDCEDSIKKDVFLQLKSKNNKLMKVCNQLTGTIRKYYEPKKEKAFFELIYYWEQYIEYSGKSDITDFRTFLQLANLEYKYFFVEKLDFPSNYRDYQIKLINSYDANINLIKGNLERSFKSVINNENLKRNLFEYNNILGDLNLNIFLLIKDFNTLNIELCKEFLRKSISYYKKAQEYNNYKGDKFIAIEYLPIFTDFLNKLQVLNFLDVVNKIESLKKHFKNYLLEE